MTSLLLELGAAALPWIAVFAAGVAAGVLLANEWRVRQRALGRELDHTQLSRSAGR